MTSRNLKIMSLLAAILMLPLTGCVSRVQTLDFARSEFARVTADIIGQVLLIFFQAISPFGAA